MISKLYLYFGLIGIASIIAWLSAAALNAWYARKKQRTLFYVRALFIALAALILADMNSYNVSFIQADRSQEMEEAKQRQMVAREAEMRSLRERAADIRFVEDDKYDRYDLAGVKSEEKKSVFELASEGKDTTPLYKQSGRQRRDSQAGGEDEDYEDEANVSVEDAELRSVKMLPEQDRIRATRLAKLNLRVSGVVFLLALILLIFDYFSRFNTSFNSVLPLPVSGRAVDLFFPKTHSLLVRSGNPDFTRAYLETVLRKGEAFLYFGPREVIEALNPVRVHIPVSRMFSELKTLFLFPSLLIGIKRLKAMVLKITGRPPFSGWLQRLQSWSGWGALRSLASKIWRSIKSTIFLLISKTRQFVRDSGVLKIVAKAGFVVKEKTGLSVSALAPNAKNVEGKVNHLFSFRGGAINFMPADLIVLTPEHKPFSSSFIFESAWFSRYSFVIDDSELTASMAASLVEFLGDRYRPHAAAWKTVHIVWDSSAVSRQDLESLVFFAKEANFKLTLLDPDPADSPLKELVEETQA